MGMNIENSSLLFPLTSNPLYQWASQYVGEIYVVLLTFTIGIFAFAIFIWYFYRTLSKRDIFELKFNRKKISVKHEKLSKILSVLGYGIKYGILFPFYVCFWFAVLSIFLLLLAKGLSTQQILLFSACLVATVRITAYYKEELSRDLAKLLPFVLLTYIIIEPSFFSLETTLSRLSELVSFLYQIPQFLLYGIVLEWVLRILYFLKVFLLKLKVKRSFSEENKEKQESNK